MEYYSAVKENTVLLSLLDIGIVEDISGIQLIRLVPLDPALPRFHGKCTSATAQHEKTVLSQLQTHNY